MLSPQSLVNNLKQLVKQRTDTSDESEVVKALIQFYSIFLCQDPWEGSEFDNLVLDTLNLLYVEDAKRHAYSRRINRDRRIDFITDKMLEKQVKVKRIGEGDPKESDKYCPIPEYGIALWID